MPDENRFTDRFACPRCDKSPLSEKNGAYRCSACKVDYPSVGDIPWLFAEPEASLGEWRNRLHFSLQQLANESQRIQAELAADGIDSLTRKRLERQVKAVDEHRDMLRKILEPIDIQSMQASNESYLALRTRLPIDQGIQTYYANIHRDWCWGDTENEASINEIKAIAGEGGAKKRALGDTLILGAGACRLAYDIHMQLDTGHTIAMDFNPLLLLVARSVMQGEAQELYEFPIAPKSLEDFAVLRKLSAPEPVRDNFHLVFADALRPPFAAASFDTVVTPWLIDIVNEPLPIQAARINRLLKPQGRWINFGSLAFDHPERARRYSPEETLAIVKKAGFAKPRAREQSIPYMCSPASRHGRQETVFTFAAEKSSDVEAAARHKALPDWIVTGKEPVPLLQSFRNQAMSTQIYSYIMTLIDGKRTIADMAKILEQQKLMTRQEAEPALRTFLTRMYDDSERNSGF
jgi:ubiquinone/menaquinone biosynthesis C-methylase UbiE